MIKIFSRGSILLLPLFLLILSCTEDNIATGIELLPDSDRLNAVDTIIPIKCFTYKGANGNVSNSGTGSFPLGNVLDPVFGETISEVAMEVLYSAEHHYRRSVDDTQDQPKSLKLYLNVTDSVHFGDSAAIDIGVNLLNSRFNYDISNSSGVVSDMYDNTENKAVSIEFDYLYSPSEPLIPEFDTLAKYMVVDLDINMANILMDTNIYSTSASFYDALPGILLRPSIKSGLGSLHSILADNSLLVLEYLRPGGNSEGEDTIIFSNYTIEKYHCNYRFIHENRNAEIETVFRDTINQADKFYLQGLGGTKGIIKLDALAQFKEEKGNQIGVNYAEIVFPISKEYLDDTVTFSLPTRILARASEGFILPDDENNETYVDGYLDKKNFEYRINISEYVHLFLTDKYELFNFDLFTANMKNTISSDRSTSYSTIDYRTLNRVVLESGNNPDKEAFLRVIYTELEH